MMFWDSGGWPWWQAGPMWLAVIAFWALLIWIVYALDERLARGEIEPEGYRRLREALDGSPGRPAGNGSER